MSNKKAINILLDQDLYEKFDSVLNITGQTKTSVIEDAVKSYVARYVDEDDVFNPIPGRFFERFSLNRGNGIIEEKENVKYCTVLRDRNIMGAPYKVIFCDGNILSVPAENVIVDPVR